jgi:hypothetical protein
MNRYRTAVLAAAATAASVAFSIAPATTPIARADGFDAGDSCPALHATTKDANGRTLWCNPTMTGNHNLVWQYGGPS